MSTVSSPCDWIIERLGAKKPLFSIRINDGEMTQMFRAVPEGKELGTVVNPAWANWELGDALNMMLLQMAVGADLDAILIGCSWNTPRVDALGMGKFGPMVRACGLADSANWCHEHWPLEGVIDGSTVRLLEHLKRGRKTVLVTCRRLADAAHCLRCPLIKAPDEDSWHGREGVYRTAKVFASSGYTFLWCAGGGLKPTAWQLFKEFPQSSHIDVGHLFNGAMGLTDYGWLQRRDGPWYEPYFAPGGFRDWIVGVMP